MCVRRKQEVSNQIDKIIKRAKHTNPPFTLLILGPENSGKSTLINQIKILYKGGYSESEKLKYKLEIRDNCYNSLQTLLLLDQITLPDNLQSHKQLVLACCGSTLENCSENIEVLWASPAIKDIYSKISLPSNASYFLDNIRKFSDPNFIPTHQDIINSRITTRGISTIDFTIESTCFKLIDIGGQKSEQRKWLHCFDNVYMVIFVVPLDEYDMMSEDRSKSRLEEFKESFSMLTSNPSFSKCGWLLFLNKTDLLEIKLKKVPLRRFFPDAPDSADYNVAYNYILNMFVKAHKGSYGLYPFATCATNTSLIQQIFSAVNDKLVSDSLREVGFL